MVDLTLHCERLTQDLTALSRLGGADLEATLARLLPAAEAPIRIRLVEALIEASEELNALVPALLVQARLTGSELTFAVGSAQETAEIGGELDARISLRLPEELKFRIEAAASQEGLSLNAWLVKTLTRSTTQALSAPTPSTTTTPTVGRHLRGRGQA